MSHPARNYYVLEFAVKKLVKACEVLNLTPEMVFRAADLKQEKVVTRPSLEHVLKEVCRTI